MPFPRRDARAIAKLNHMRVKKLEVISIGGCWCGGEYNHDWPGKEEGKSHPAMNRVFLTLVDPYGNGDPDEVPHVVLRLTEGEVNSLHYFCAQPPEDWYPEDDDTLEDGNLQAYVDDVKERAFGGIVLCPGTFTDRALCDFPLRKREVDALLNMEKFGPCPGSPDASSGSFFSDLMERKRIS